MTPETREKAINLMANKHLTIDSINEIVTILMLEKATILTEEMVIKQLEGVVAHSIPMTELEIIQRSLDEARQAGYTKKANELEALIANPVNVCERFEEIEKKRPFIL